MDSKTAKVQIADESGRTKWFPCAIIGRNPAPVSFRREGLTEWWYDVELVDGRVFEYCNPACVKVLNDKE